MNPIHIRINHMQAQTPFIEGFLLPDNRNAIYVSDGSVKMVPVVQFAYDGLYAQDGPHTIVAYVPFKPDISSEALCTDILTRLNGMSAFELLTEYFNEEADAYLVIDDRSDYDDHEDPPYDEYGRLR